MKIVVNKELAAEIKNTLEKSKIVYVPASANHHAYQYASNRTKKQTLQPSKTAIRIQYANKSPLVATTIQPLKITRNDWKKIAISETQKLNNELQTNKHICKAVGKRVSSANIRHSYYSKLSGKVRNFNEAKNHTPYIPFALSVIENGIEDKELSENGFHEIIGRADIIDKGKNVRIGIAVILVDKNDKELTLEHTSIFRLNDSKNLIKGLNSLKCLRDKSENPTFIVQPLSARHNLSIARLYNLSTPNLDNIFTVNKSLAAEIMKNINERNDIDVLNKSLTFSGWKLQGRTTFRGLNISIENRKGSIRRGIDHNGEKWAIKMNYDYGYIRGTEGVDGDHVDCYLGGNEDAKNVYIVHQNDPDTHKYDEDKCMLGFDTLADARKAYLSQYNKPGFLGKIDIMPFEDFKEKVVLKKNHGKKLVTKSLNDYVKEIKSGFDFDMMKRVAL